MEAGRIIHKYMKVKIIANCTETFPFTCLLAFSTRTRDQINSNTNKQTREQGIQEEKKKAF